MKNISFKLFIIIMLILTSILQSTSEQKNIENNSLRFYI